MISLLQQAGDILIPPVVNLELERQITGWNSLDWLSIHQLESEYINNAHAWVSTDQLDPGEAEAIGLALQVKADWLLTDDAQARRFAERLALEVHGSVGLFLWAVAAGYVNYSTAKAGSFLVRSPALRARISPGVCVRAIPALRFIADLARPSHKIFRAAFTSRSWCV